MAHLLKQSIAYTFRLGPFVSSTDGVTQQNSLTIAYTSVLLSKAGGALTAKAETTNLTGTGADGHYTCLLGTGDTATLGTLRVFCQVSTALPVWQDFMVLPANVYDALVADTGVIRADARQILGTAVATPATAGVLDVNIKNIADAVVNTATAQIGANVVTQANIDFGALQKTSLNAATPASVQNIAANGSGFTALGDTRIANLDTTVSSRLAPAGTLAVCTLVTTATNLTNAPTNGDLTATMKTSVQTAADAALVAENLDHLLKVAAVAGDAVDSSIIARMTSKAATPSFASYVNTTESLEALRDNGDSAWITATGFSTHSAADVKTAVEAAGSHLALILADTGTDGVVLPQAQADKVWGTAARALTDKADFALSSASRDAIWDQASAVTLSFETLLARAYQMISNKMTVNESTGAVALRNIGDTVTLATGEVVSSSGTTSRAELSWV